MGTLWAVCNVCGGKGSIAIPDVDGLVEVRDCPVGCKTLRVTEVGLTSAQAERLAVRVSEAELELLELPPVAEEARRIEASLEKTALAYPSWTALLDLYRLALGGKRVTEGGS